MYKCQLCDKEFIHKSAFRRHKNKKFPCNKIKIKNPNLKCILCNVLFSRVSEMIRHDKTKKHINNYYLKNGIHIYNSNIHITVTKKIKVICKQKEKMKCNTCNLSFNCNAEQIRHEKTKKHIYNLKNRFNNINKMKISYIIH